MQKNLIASVIGGSVCKTFSSRVISSWLNLISALEMARPEANGLVKVILLGGRIDALPGGCVAQLKRIGSTG
jgi:hypothetical protein